MAHVRHDSKKLSTTISLEEQMFSLIDDYRFEKRKDNRSAAIADLILKGLKYEALLQKNVRRCLVYKRHLLFLT
jgi:metal-responsive CopG/Arc/MetJ family transcriptional regulator